jgi:hypothetical protein
MIENIMFIPIDNGPEAGKCLFLETDLCFFFFLSSEPISTSISVLERARMVCINQHRATRMEDATSIAKLPALSGAHPKN